MDIYIMTGPIQTGKTSWVRRMLPMAAEQGLRVTGVWSPAIFEGDEKTGIMSQLLPSGEEFQLAKKRSFKEGDKRPDGRKRLGWDFSDEAMERINTHFDSLGDDFGDLFLVDEFGALEFCQDKGYTSGMRIMDAAKPAKVLLLLRPDLVEVAQERWGEAKILGIDSSIEDFLAELR